MGISFKLEDNYGKKNKRKNNKLFIIVFLIVVIVFLIIYSVFNYLSKMVNYVDKKNIEKEYIYTVKRQENSFQEGIYDEVPAINLVGDEFDAINKAILNKYLQVSQESEYDYGYSYSQSDNILSLKVTYAYYPSDDVIYPIRYFETFNINLKNGKILSDNDILDMYDLSQERVNSFLEAKFRSFYSDIVNDNYYSEKECNYDCFLKNRGISDNYLNGVSYYIEDNSLIALKYFYTYSFYEEEQYFKNWNYEFLVKE